MRKLLIDYAGYNLWANERVIHLLQPLNELVNEEVRGSFPTIRKTLFHIWDAEYIWQRRIIGESIKDFPSKSFDADVKLEGLLLTSGAFLKLSSELTDLEMEVEYFNLKGEPFIQKVHEMMHHCLNHSTFHRGQVYSTLRMLGYTGELPSIDMVAWYREKKH